MVRLIAMAFWMAATVWSGEAVACWTQLPEEQARADAAKMQFLHRYADVAVFGIWVENGKADAAGHSDGYVLTENGENPEIYPVQLDVWIDCSPNPNPGDKGIFYLRADIDEIEDFDADSPNLLREGMTYDLIEFKALLEEEH